MVNLYKLLFLSSHFSFQPNKRVFHPPTFPSLQPNTHEEKLNIFHPPTFPSSHKFPSFHFSTPSTKRTLKVLTLDLTPTISNPRYLSQLVMICAPSMSQISSFTWGHDFGLKKRVVFCLLMAWPDAFSYDSNISSRFWHSTVVASQNSRLSSANSRCESLTPPLQDTTPFKSWLSMFHC